MKILKHIILALSIVFGISSCGIPRYATLSNTPDLSRYKYVYITPTKEITSITGGAFGNQYGVYGATESRSVNPADMIAGQFMKQGFVRLPELNEELKPMTIVVNYGESGKRSRGLGSSLEVTIQLLDASTYDLICTATAEAMGETEADDMRKAINKCLDAIFK